MRTKDGSPSGGSRRRDKSERRRTWSGPTRPPAAPPSPKMRPLWRRLSQPRPEAWRFGRLRLSATWPCSRPSQRGYSLSPTPWTAGSMPMRLHLRRPARHSPGSMDSTAATSPIKTPPGSLGRNTRSCLEASTPPPTPISLFQTKTTNPTWTSPTSWQKPSPRSGPRWTRTGTLSSRSGRMDARLPKSWQSCWKQRKN